MTITYTGDHAAQGVARIIERYRNPRISALLTSWLSEVQEVEDAFWGLLIGRTLDDAEGALLEVLGRIVGQSREGRLDSVYRLWISARVLVNRSSGKAEQLIAIARKLVGSEPVRLEEYFPAGAVMHIESNIDAYNGGQIAKLLVQAKAAGVNCQLEWFSNAHGEPFTLATGTTSQFGAQGFGSGAFCAVSAGGDVVWADVVPADSLTDEDGIPLITDDDGDFLIEG